MPRKPGPPCLDHLRHLSSKAAMWLRTLNAIDDEPIDPQRAVIVRLFKRRTARQVFEAWCFLRFACRPIADDTNDR